MPANKRRNQRRGQIHGGALLKINGAFVRVLSGKLVLTTRGARHALVLDPSGSVPEAYARAGRRLRRCVPHVSLPALAEWQGAHSSSGEAQLRLPGPLGALRDQSREKKVKLFLEQLDPVALRTAIGWPEQHWRVLRLLSKEPRLEHLSHSCPLLLTALAAQLGALPSAALAETRLPLFSPKGLFEAAGWEPSVPLLALLRSVPRRWASGALLQRLATITRKEPRKARVLATLPVISPSAVMLVDETGEQHALLLELAHDHAGDVRLERDLWLRHWRARLLQQRLKMRKPPIISVRELEDTEAELLQIAARDTGSAWTHYRAVRDATTRYATRMQWRQPTTLQLLEERGKIP